MSIIPENQELKEKTIYFFYVPSEYYGAGITGHFIEGDIPLQECFDIFYREFCEVIEHQKLFWENQESLYYRLTEDGIQKLKDLGVTGGFHQYFGGIENIFIEYIQVVHNYIEDQNIKVKYVNEDRIKFGNAIE